MEENDEATGYSAMFEDDILLKQTDWDHLLSKKVKFNSWKELKNNNIIIHVNKAKDELMDQLEKEMVTVKLMMNESLSSHINITVEEVSELNFGWNEVVYKYFVQQNVPFLSSHGNFASFIGTYFLLTRTSYYASSIFIE